MSAKVIKAPLHKRKRILAADIKTENAAAAKNIVQAKKARLSMPQILLRSKDSLLGIFNTPETDSISYNVIMPLLIQQKKTIVITRLLAPG